MDLAAHKVNFIATYLILHCELTFKNFVKDNNHHTKIMGLDSIKCDQVTFKLHKTLFSSLIR